MKFRKLKLSPKLEPYRGVILFAGVMLIANFAWKYNVFGDESPTFDSTVTLWGMDISDPFVWMAKHVANITKEILNTVGYPVVLKPGNIFSYSATNSVQIVWACTGMKQAFISTCIFLFARGSWKKKIWYIPLTLLVIYLFNIFRISFIIACMQYHRNWFQFLHLYAFKYTFYLIIFFMWVYWEEKIVGHPKPLGLAE